MSIQAEINRIKGNVADAYAAVGEKGGAVPEEQTSGGLGTAVRSIPTGGVTSFNGRAGEVVPAAGDYTVSQVTGAAPKESPVFTGHISLGRKSGTEAGEGSVALGRDCEASNYFCLAEGDRTAARGMSSHAEGYLSVALTDRSHAEGYCTYVCGIEGGHAEGAGCIADEDSTYLPIESASGTTLIVADNGIIYSPGNRIGRIRPGSEIYLWENDSVMPSYIIREVASVDASARKITLTESVLEGCRIKNAVVPRLKPSSYNSTFGSPHAEGRHCAAINHSAHAEGQNTIASGYYSHAEGEGTIAAGACQHAGGAYNVIDGVSTNKVIIGKGVDEDRRANCFRVTDTGVYATGNYNSTGADYAELFEWADGNPDGEDRVGRFVTLDGAKIRLAGPEDRFILGIVSGNPSVVGDVHDDQWQGMYLYDVFGRPIWEDVEIPAEAAEVPDPENPENTITNVIVPARVERRQKLNPDYDPSQKYLPRSKRPEWGCVGLMGKLVLLDDGTCQVNGWAAPGAGGAATASEAETPWRVMERLDRDGMTLVRVMRV